MKQILMHAFGFLAAALLALGCNPAVGDPLKPYPMPSWSQQLPAATRFVVLSNWIDANFTSGGAAVLDLETGLVWERSPSSTQFHWPDAQTHCNLLKVGNRMGWRVPTLQELTSLVDPTVTTGVSLPAGHPFLNVQSSSPYWSATTYAPDPCCAWDVQFGFGGSLGAANEDTITRGAWCARGGQGVEAQ